MRCLVERSRYVRAHLSHFPKISKSEETNMDTIDALSVDTERSENLKKAKLENGYYNIVDGEKVSTSKRLSVINLLLQSN
jgi:hypothetical protein